MVIQMIFPIADRHRFPSDVPFEAAAKAMTNTSAASAISLRSISNEFNHSNETKLAHAVFWKSF